MASWNDKIYEMIARQGAEADTEDSLREQVRDVAKSTHQYIFATSGKEQGNTYTAHIAQRSFENVFGAICKILSGGRSVELDDRKYPIGGSTVRKFELAEISGFERGLYLDFILFAIEQLHEMRYSKKRPFKYINGDEIYATLKRVTSNDGVLRGKVNEVDRNTVTVSAAYKTQILYFSDKNLEPRFPMLRKRKVDYDVKYCFPAMGKEFYVTRDEAEFWLNFYLREKQWGTNLAVLLSDYNPELSQNKKRIEVCAEIWGNLDSSRIIATLMSIPSPAYRLSYANSILRAYFRHLEERTAEKFSWTEFVGLCNSQKNIWGAVENLSTPPFSETLQQLNETAFAVLLAVWIAMQSAMQNKGEPLIHGKLPAEDSARAILNDDILLKQLQENLCGTAQAEVERICGISNSTGLTELKKRWPLLLLENCSSKHIQNLIATRDYDKAPETGDNKSFAGIQEQCYIAEK